MTPPDTSPARLARIAGALYAVIIIFGLWSEVAVRSALIVPGDAAATAANVVANEGLFRLSFAADTLMALADVGLAVLLFVLLRPVNAALALTAMAFRLVQAAIIGASLIHQQLAILLAANGNETLAMQFLAAHAAGYDLGLVFFGIACLLLGWLIVSSRFLPRALGWLVMAAGPVYLVGSFLRFLAPAHVEAFAPAYVICVLAETAFCLWLLVRGVDGAAWQNRRAIPAG
ncbi:MAG: DUF4386 domain-containing protein [Oricola sp.]